MTKSDAIVQRITVVSTSSLPGARMTICWYHVGAMSIWQYSEHIVTEAATDGSEADLRGMIGTLLPEARDVRTVGPSALLKISCSILGISYHVGTMSIWQYSGHIVTEAKQMEAEADLRGTIGMVLPEAREQSEHVEGLAQLCRRQAMPRRYHP